MADCNNCKYEMCWEYAEPCSSCTNMTGEPTNWEPQTNADHIRAMSDADLAIFLNEVKIDGMLRNNEMPTSCFDWLEWLKQEEENG